MKPHSKRNRSTIRNKSLMHSIKSQTKKMELTGKHVQTQAQINNSDVQELFIIA